MATRPLCSVEGCGKPRRAKDLCRSHYYRMRNHGDPLGGKAAQGEPMAWIIRHANHAGDACLPWPFARFPNGYGSVVHKGSTINASRVMCLTAHGDPPEGKPFALHSCAKGHEGCVNKVHLRWGTQAENIQQAVADGNWNKKGEPKPSLFHAIQQPRPRLTC